MIKYTAQIEIPEASTPVACGDCSWEGEFQALEPVDGCALTPGDPSPAGRCPECDTLAYPKSKMSDAADGILRDLLAFEASQFDGPDDMDRHISGTDAIHLIDALRRRAKVTLGVKPQVLAKTTRYYITMTWDSFPDGGSYGTEVEAMDCNHAEVLCKKEMAGIRAEAGDETSGWYLEEYGDDWHVIDCFPLDEFIEKYSQDKKPTPSEPDAIVEQKFTVKLQQLVEEFGQAVVMAANPAEAIHKIMEGDFDIDIDWRESGGTQDLRATEVLNAGGASVWKAEN